MLFRSFYGRFLAGSVLVGFMLAVAGCQSGDGGVFSGLKGSSDAENKAVAESQAKIKASELRAYCPKVTLRDGTAFYNTYANAGQKKRKPAADQAEDVAPQDDSSKIVYQASISDVTRDCVRSNGTFSMAVAVAGKVVPGPMAAPGSITMPIRIVVMSGSDVLYSQLHQYPVQISDTSVATQFVFKDPNIVVPEPVEQNYQVFAGYDEGPAKKTSGDETN